jgi:hypothetical protein
LTLVSEAQVWRQAVELSMDKTHTVLVALKKQGEELQKQFADTLSMLRSINETLAKLSNCVPQVDDSIKGLQQKNCKQLGHD